jgi:hypothetical protein
MVVRAKENRAEVLLALVGPPYPGPEEGWVTCEVRVEEAGPVPGWPNLLADAVGRTLTALFPPGLAPSLTPGTSWRCTCELVKPRVIRVRDASSPAGHARD